LVEHNIHIGRSCRVLQCAFRLPYVCRILCLINAFLSVSRFYFHFMRIFIPLIFFLSVLILIIFTAIQRFYCSFFLLLFHLCNFVFKLNNLKSFLLSCPVFVEGYLLIFLLFVASLHQLFPHFLLFFLLFSLPSFCLFISFFLYM
jgi:hypothetical protein